MGEAAERAGAAQQLGLVGHAGIAVLDVRGKGEHVRWPMLSPPAWVMHGLCDAARLTPAPMACTPAASRAWSVSRTPSRPQSSRWLLARVTTLMPAQASERAVFGLIRYE